MLPDRVERGIEAVLDLPDRAAGRANELRRVLVPGHHQVGKPAALFYPFSGEADPVRVAQVEDDRLPEQGLREPLEDRRAVHPEHGQVDEDHVEPSDPEQLAEPEWQQNQIPVDRPGDPAGEPGPGPEPADRLDQAGKGRGEGGAVDPELGPPGRRQLTKDLGCLVLGRLWGEEGDPERVPGDGAIRPPSARSLSRVHPANLFRPDQSYLWARSPVIHTAGTRTG